MKKVLVVIMLLTCVELYAQQKVIAGYGDLPWGSSIEDVKKKYENTDEMVVDGLIDGARIFMQENESTRRLFRFYNNELYYVKVMYIDPTATMANAIVQKLVEIYGYFENSGEFKDASSTTAWMSLNYSPEMTLLLAETNLVNDLGYLIGYVVSVEYSNPITSEEIETIEINIEKDTLEL